MATTSVRPAPAKDTAAKPERPQGTRQTPPLEDRIDYMMVRNARTLAAKRGEKPLAWSDFKKKLSR